MPTQEPKEKAEGKKAAASLSVEQETAAVELELKKLQLEDLTQRVEKERSRRADILRAHLAQQRSLDDANHQIQSQQKACKHKKGGKNRQGILNGNDQNYSVVHHTYPWGALGVICTRCGHEWNKPKAELAKTNKKLYQQLLAEYMEAVNFPTDNEPSGTALFTFERIGAEEMSAAQA